MIPLSDTIREKVKQHFSASEDRKHAEALLLRYGEENEREVERVRCDLFELCGSSLERLAHYIEVAKRDYRDIIFWAEYETDERGVSVLKAKFRHTPPNA